MPSKMLKNEDEIKDFVLGCTFMGTGGGGSPAIGERLLLEDLKEGREIKWVDMSNISDDTWVCTPFGMGSIAAPTKEFMRKMKRMGATQAKVKRPLVEAVRILEGYSGTRVGAIIAFELGGVNTPGPLDAALRLGVQIVDGDHSGRALPEVVQGLPCVYGKKILPLACCDQWGNKIIIKEAFSYGAVEMLGKMISIIGCRTSSDAGFLLQWKDIKEAIIPGTLTLAYNVGKAIRQAREAGANPVEAAVKAVNGWLLFEGKVSGQETEDKEGYFWGTNTLEGIGRFKGHNFKIFFKNENHITWLDGETYATSPDIITVVQLKTAEPILNSDLKKGDVVAVVGGKNEKFRTERGLALVGPKHYGFEIEYVPIEQKVKQWV